MLAGKPARTPREVPHAGPAGFAEPGSDTPLRMRSAVDSCEVGSQNAPGQFVPALPWSPRPGMGPERPRAPNTGPFAFGGTIGGPCLGDHGGPLLISILTRDATRPRRKSSSIKYRAFRVANQTGIATWTDSCTLERYVRPERPGRSSGPTAGPGRDRPPTGGGVKWSGRGRRRPGAPAVGMGWSPTDFRGADRVPSW
jgi:hypothetical protein